MNKRYINPNFLVFLKVAFVFLWVSLPTTAQKYPYKVFNIKDGLSAMQCLGVFEDSRGFIWVTTKNGLNRYDGKYFKKYFVEDGLDDNSHFSQIIELPNGEISFVNGRYLFFFDNKTFTKVRIPDEVKIYDPADNLFFDSDSNRIIFISNEPEDIKPRLVVMYDVSQKKFSKQNFPGINGDLSFSPIFYDKKDKSFYGISISSRNIKEGIFKFRNGKYEKIYDTYLREGVYISQTFKNHILLKFKDLEGDYIDLYKTVNGSFIPLLKRKKTNMVIEVLNPINEDQVVSNGSSVYYIKKGSKKIELIASELGASRVGQSSSDGKTIWIPTEKGLLQFINNGIRYFDEKEAEYIWSVTEDDKNNIWMLPFGGAIKIFDGNKIYSENRHLKLFPFIKSNQTVANYREGSLFYFSAFKDMHGTLWLPNTSCQLQFKNGSFKRTNENAAYFNFYDKEHDYVFQAGNHGINLFPSLRPNEIFTLYGKKDLIPYQNYMYIYKDRKKRYWLGGWGGMNRFESFSEIFKKRSKEYSIAKKNIPFKGFITMFEDADSILWAGTTSGLYYYVESDDSWKQVLPNQIKKFVTLIGEISEDKLIIGVDEGLMILDRHKLKAGQAALIKLYNYHNGFDGLEPGQNGLFKDSKGRLWITSGSILSYLEPDKLDLDNSQLKPYIDKINYKNVAFTNDVNLAFEENNFHVEVGAVGFNRPLESLYSFAIDDKPWSSWQKSSEYFVPAMPNGQHQIKVRAKTNGILDNELIPKVLTVNIQAPFYKSPNFSKYLGVACLFLFSWFLYSFVRSRYEKRKLAEKERTINYLQIQTLQAQLNPHFLFNALSSLQHLILKKETVLAKSSLTKLATLMRSYLESSVSANNPRIRKNEISLRHKIELLNSYLDLESIQHNDKFSYVIETSPDLPLDSIKLPPLIIQPFVENAIKHGLVHKEGKGSLVVKFEQIDEVLICTIDDDGIGRKAAAEIKKRSEHSYKSYGTHLVHERVKLLNETDYKIEIQTIDKAEGGTRVIIKIAQKYED
ncbi:hypothetical protein EGI22_20615 [Lacihabitans sp. LS3-19]|uniref:sensor histidine kinase n=1 Tax=Lacihabitans sp. LS3-19 TaxID=2487335 RepID=UPI0020CEAE8F|nr:histidine kinase [Lacihabitans sp. LS3-19]MCP9770316.1 hypothetical protein [Lacihabitans sp. LS3-19]